MKAVACMQLALTEKQCRLAIHISGAKLCDIETLHGVRHKTRDNDNPPVSKQLILSVIWQF